MVRSSAGTPSASSSPGRIVLSNRCVAPRLTSVIAASEAGIKASTANSQNTQSELPSATDFTMPAVTARVSSSTIPI